jgi:two-component sensor histidine kinase
VFKTLRRRIALLLIAANLPVIIFAIAIGKQEFTLADQFDRDRLVQTAALVAARAALNTHAGRAPADALAAGAPYEGVATAIVGPDGAVVAQEATGLDEAGASWLPKSGLPDKQDSDDARILKGRSAEGAAFRYAVAPIEGSDMKAIAGARFDFLGHTQTQWLFFALGLPALMVLSCIGLVMFGIERFVLRWIRALRAMAASFDGSQRDLKAPPIEGAPKEFAELGEAFEAMSSRVQDRSSALETAIDSRDRLLRELHHRVKNNFQMIASLLALQRQEAPATLSAVLRAPEDRVRAMAAAYKVSYASGEIGHVGVAALIRDVALQARQTTGGRSFEVSAHFPEEDFEIGLDFAVSLALLVTELLNAASAAGEVASVTAIALPDGKVSLTISGPPRGWLPTTGLPHRLIRAYADQLSTGLEEADDGAIKLIIQLAQDKPFFGMRAGAA